MKSIKTNKHKFKTSVEVIPLYKKAVDTLREVCRQVKQDKIFFKIVATYNEPDLENTFKLLIRVKMALYARKCILAVLGELRIFDTLTEDIKSIVDSNLD